MLYRPAAAIVFRARLTRPPSLRVPYRARVSRGQSEGAKLGKISSPARSEQRCTARHPFGAARALLGASQMAVRLQPD
jgi:hypothetical protein